MLDKTKNNIVINLPETKEIIYEYANYDEADNMYKQKVKEYAEFASTLCYQKFCCKISLFSGRDLHKRIAIKTTESKF